VPMNCAVKMPLKLRISPSGPSPCADRERRRRSCSGPSSRA
jgi:hypothetical protein